MSKAAMLVLAADTTRARLVAPDLRPVPTEFVLGKRLMGGQVHGRSMRFKKFSFPFLEKRAIANRRASRIRFANRLYDVLTSASLVSPRDRATRALVAVFDVRRGVIKFRSEFHIAERASGVFTPHPPCL